MEPETRQVHICYGGRSFQTHENIPQTFGVLVQDAAMVVVFVKAFEAFVADRPNHILP
jgi:hypothetical protein